MPKIPYTKLDAVLRNHGFKFVRNGGKHVVWHHEDGTLVALPYRPHNDYIEGAIAKRILTKEGS